MTEGADIALGCDLGATNLRVAAVQPDGTVLSSIRRKLDDRAPGVVADELADGAREVLRIVGASPASVRAIGVGVASPASTAETVLGNSAMRPSPARSTTRPPWRVSTSLTAAWWPRSAAMVPDSSALTSAL